VFLLAPRWMVGIHVSYRLPYVIRSDTFAVVAVDLRAFSLPAWIPRLLRNRIVRPMSRNGPCPLESIVQHSFSKRVIVPIMPYRRGQHRARSGSIQLSSNSLSCGWHRLSLTHLIIVDTPA